MADDIRDELRPVIEAVGLRRSAELADISASNLSNWLAGKPTLGEERRNRLVRALRDHCRDESQWFQEYADRLERLVTRPD